VLDGSSLMDRLESDRRFTDEAMKTAGSGLPNRRVSRIGTKPLSSLSESREFRPLRCRRSKLRQSALAAKARTYSDFDVSWLFKYDFALRVSSFTVSRDTSSTAAISSCVSPP
jgi:hypothetical protein